MAPFFDTRLFAPGDRVLLALSGGADSLSLFHALTAAREELAIELAALHVHHGMRGAEADADVRFLQSVCADRGVPLHVEERDVPALALERRISIEEAGRIVRYVAFDHVARAHRCNKVATAHHADDQVETILLNLFRGAGIDGLTGIPARRPLSPEPDAPELVRPLLQTWRREIEAYSREHGLQPREDRTNLDLRYRRNRIRLELLPRLEEFEPALGERLIRLAGLARDDTSVLEELAADLLAQSAVSEPPTEVKAHEPAPRRWRPPAPPVGQNLRPCLASDTAPGSAGWYDPPLRDETEPHLRRAVLAAAPPALARRALRLALRQLAGFDITVDAALLERLLALCRGKGAAAVDLPGGPWRARRRGEVLVFESTAGAPPAPTSVFLTVPGVTDAPEFGLRIRTAPCPPPPDPRQPPDRAVVDMTAVSGALTLRAPRTGDRFHPLGAPGSRLLSDLFIDRKIPRPQRRRWPVIADQSGILWVVGVALAERARVRPATTRCLLLVVERLLVERGG